MKEALQAWAFTRSETSEFIDVLTDDQLQFLPGSEPWQPLYFQFACIARTQLIYTKALKTGIMDFSYFTDPTFPDKHSLQSKAELVSALSQADESWHTAISNGTVVDWNGISITVAGHIYRLIAHERLHHGQLISYFTLAGYELPSIFKSNWAL